MHGLPLLQVVAVAMLILANAFFVAAEFAMVSTRDTRIEQLLAAKVPGARAVRRLQHELEYFLPAVQLGVTLCSLAIGWIGEPLAANAVLAGLTCCRSRRHTRLSYAHIASVDGSRYRICLHHVLSRHHRRTGPEIACSSPCRGSCRCRCAAHAHFYADGAACGPPTQGIGCHHPAWFRHPHDGAGGRPLARGTQAHHYRRPPPGPASALSGDASSTAPSSLMMFPYAKS